MARSSVHSAGRRAKGELPTANSSSIQNEELINRRRDQICDAALKLFLRKGVAATTIRDLCAASGVNQASIYDYIADKNDILRHLLNRVWFRSDVPTLPEIIDKNSNMTLAEVLTDYFDMFWEKKHDAVVLMYRSVHHMSPDDRKVMRQRDRKLIDELARRLSEKSGIPRTDLRLEILADICIFLSAFVPMRSFMHPGIERRRIAKIVATGVSAMLSEMLATPEKTDGLKA